jgi:hypothetical protein
MPTIELSHTEFGQLMGVLANATGPNITWAIVNPLLMKIGEQLRMQQPPLNPNDGQGKETHHGH